MDFGNLGIWWDLNWLVFVRLSARAWGGRGGALSEECNLAILLQVLFWCLLLPPNMLVSNFFSKTQRDGRVVGFGISILGFQFKEGLTTALF